MKNLSRLSISRKPIKPYLFILFILSSIGVWAICFAPLQTVQADDPVPQEQQPLRVVIKPIEPFVMKNDEQLTGFSIDLWREIALITQLPFEFIEVDTVAEQLNYLAANEADLAIAAISMTPAREDVFDFSYPYYRAGLQIMTRHQEAGFWPSIRFVLTSSPFLATLGSLLVVMLVMGHLAWLVERKDNPDFPQRYWPGIWEGLWWAVVTVTTVGYGDKTLKNMGGRILAMFWMFVGIFLIANFTAVVTAEVTLAKMQTSITGPNDLAHKRIASVTGTTSAAWLRSKGLPFLPVADIETAYPLLAQGTIDAIVYDAPVLQYHALTSGQGQLQVAGKPFDDEYYGIALPTNSPYKEVINKALLEIFTNGTYDTLYTIWFGAQAHR